MSYPCKYFFRCSYSHDGTNFTPDAQTMSVMLPAPLCPELGAGIWESAAVLLTLMLSCCAGRGLSASLANTCLCYAWRIRAAASLSSVR